MTFDDQSIIITIGAQDVQRWSKGEKEDWEDDEEWPNICYSGLDQFDVEGSGIEHTEPIKHLCPNDTNKNGADYTASINIWEI